MLKGELLSVNLPWEEGTGQMVACNVNQRAVSSTQRYSQSAAEVQRVKQLFPTSFFFFFSIAVGPQRMGKIRRIPGDEEGRSMSWGPD